MRKPPENPKGTDSESFRVGDMEIWREGCTQGDGHSARTPAHLPRPPQLLGLAVPELQPCAISRGSRE